MQLAFIKSHLGAFDSKVPVSPLRNLSVTVSREQAKSQAKTAAVISMLFLSEITSHKNNPSPFSDQMPLWLTIFFPAVGFLILYADMQAWLSRRKFTTITQARPAPSCSLGFLALGFGYPTNLWSRKHTLDWIDAFVCIGTGSVSLLLIFTSFLNSFDTYTVPQFEEITRSKECKRTDAVCWRDSPWLSHQSGFSFQFWDVSERQQMFRCSCIQL